ncbi:MAG: hypothetical protein SGPRY_001997 [Prymnesium sp.]
MQAVCQELVLLIARPGWLDVIDLCQTFQFGRVALCELMLTVVLQVIRDGAVLPLESLRACCDVATRC